MGGRFCSLSTSPLGKRADCKAIRLSAFGNHYCLPSIFIAGLVPAIHLASAWTTGTSPVVMNEWTGRPWAAFGRVIPLLPVANSAPIIHLIQPRMGGLQATVAGCASRGIASHVRSATGRPCDERSIGAIPDVSEKMALPRWSRLTSKTLHRRRCLGSPSNLTNPEAPGRPALPHVPIPAFTALRGLRPANESLTR